MRPRSHRAAGFTLVEVLVALVIVAVGMSALLAALSSAADNTNYLRDKTFAQWVALNRVAEVRLQGRMPSKGKESGEVEFAGNRWQWEQEVSELDVPGVVRMDVKVRLAGASAGQKNKAWMGNALGVIGDAIAPPMNALDISRTWELQMQPPGGGPPGSEGTGDGSNPGTNPGGNNNDGNGDQNPNPNPNPNPEPNPGEQE
jgi:general secretion pathway protein I